MRKFAFLAVFLTLALSLTSCLNLTFNYFGETAPKTDGYETKPEGLTDEEADAGVKKILKKLENEQGIVLRS